MTRDEYVDHFTALLQAEKVELPNVEAHVRRGIAQGLKDFWGANNWRFKEFEHELSITSGLESYDLPDDFEGVKTFREQTTNQGLRLVYFPKEEFDRLVPKQDTFAQSTPQAYTIFRDADDNQKWKISFFPQPSAAITIYCLLYKTTGENVSLVPDKFQSGLEAFIAKHVYPYSHPGHTVAHNQAMAELRRLQVIDKADMSDPTWFQDGTSKQLFIGRPWV